VLPQELISAGARKLGARKLGARKLGARKVIFWPG
jgi:hypothetical protein